MGKKIKRFKYILAVAAITLIGLTVANLGCSDEGATRAFEAPNPFIDDDAPPYCVWGYVYDGGDPMSGALVEVYCNTDDEILGEASCNTGPSGYYEVYVGEGKWDEHLHCWCVSQTPDYSSSQYKLSESPPPYRLGPKNIYYP